MSEIAVGIVGDRIRVTVNGALTGQQTSDLINTLLMLVEQLERETE